VSLGKHYKSYGNSGFLVKDYFNIIFNNNMFNKHTLLYDLFQAYYNARKNKTSQLSQIPYMNIINSPLKKNFEKIFASDMEIYE